MLLGTLRDSIAHKWGDGNNYSLQQRIMYGIVSCAAEIKRRAYNSTGRFPETLIKTVKSIPLIIINSEDFPLEDTSYKVRRTTTRIPNPLMTKDNTNFLFVGTTTLALGWSYVEFQDVQFIKERRFSSREIYYTYDDGYIYTISWVGKSLKLRFVPENIIDFKNFSTLPNEDTIEDEDIIIEDSLIEGIEGLMEERRFKIETGKEDAEIQINE